jgi:hypothetical protein
VLRFDFQYIYGLLVFTAPVCDLSGLRSLAYIGYDLTIFGNKSLINLTGLDALTYIGGSLEIGSIYSEPNLALTRLTGLDNVAAGSIDNLSSGITLPLTLVKCKAFVIIYTLQTEL